MQGPVVVSQVQNSVSKQHHMRHMSHVVVNTCA
jgi:hypothetical protein